MLKQSFVQEKISDLSVAGNINLVDSKLSKANKNIGSASSRSSDLTANRLNHFNAFNSSSGSFSYARTTNNHNDFLLSHMPQWPRVHISTSNGKQAASSLMRNTRLLMSKTAKTNSSFQSVYSSNQMSYENMDFNGENYDNDEFETVNNQGRSFSNNNNNNNTNIQRGAKSNYNVTNDSTNSNSNGNNNNNDDNDNNDNNDNNDKANRNNQSESNQRSKSNQNPNNTTSNEKNNSKSKQNDNFINSAKSKNSVDSTSNASLHSLSANSFKTNKNDNLDPIMKLRYLEKSIRFIQNQHNETLNSLHQEIEKLKNENRDLHFKLATRKSSASLINNQETSSKLNESAKDADQAISFEKEFDKALKEVSKEIDLNKRIKDLKLNYEVNKIDELIVKLKDAESKNEYLTSIITQLQSKRTINSGYRPNVHVNNLANNSNNNNTTSMSHRSSTNRSAAASAPKLNLKHIYSVEPLRIKLNDIEEPRVPNFDEAESLVKKLFEIYKQQKQQISNMKLVLNGLMQSENLSNHSLVMTRDILENPNKISQFIIESNHSHVPKLSVIASVHQIHGHKYHSQILTTINSPKSPANINKLNLEAIATAATSTPTANSNMNLSSAAAIHLPPLQTLNPARFPERQRRTQLLQRQRLRKEFYH